MRTRRTLRGHLAKIYAMHWGTDSRCVLAQEVVPEAVEGSGFPGDPLLSAFAVVCKQE